jgi:hypothetical protein
MFVLGCSLCSQGTSPLGLPWHSEIAFESPIREALWNRAHWHGVGYAVMSEPPRWMMLLFESLATGVPQPMSHAWLSKKQLIVRDGWEIGLNDPNAYKTSNDLRNYGTERQLTRPQYLRR